MRGKVLTPSRGEFPPRITPAYAGKRKTTGKVKFKTEDHPRLCGEKRIECYTEPTTWGSPPPMRGKAPLVLSVIIIHRITPAYAGKRYMVDLGDSRFQDHPRLCGEKTPTKHFIRLTIGSPPPMRGKVSIQSVRSTDHGITPAYAGKRVSFPSMKCVR